VAARHWFKDTAEVVGGLRDHLGLDGIVLRYAARRVDDEARLVTVYCVVEPRDADWCPPAGGRWIARGQLDGVALSVPAQRRVVARCLDELSSRDAPVQRNAYAMPGWFAMASAWMEAHLRAAGRPPLGPVEQVKTWGISCVLRASTAAGDVYLKAPSRYFAQEATITPLLAAWYPDRTPKVVAVEAARGWLLLEDVGPALFRQEDPALWDRTVDLLGDMQRGCAGRTAELLAAGALDRRPVVLRDLIGTLAEEPEVHADAAPELVERLGRLTPRLRALCDELFAQGLPDTLVHGELHGGNVGVRDGHVRLFDWTDAAASHPFLDLVTLLPDRDREGHGGGERGGTHNRLRERYLDGFAGVVPRDRLRRAFDLAWCLGAAYQVATYVGIGRSLEPDARTEFGGGISSWLRKALERAEQLWPS
jgi:hypothetical protein